MFITEITLHNFRNFSHGTFSFHPGINLILGPNGCGKSNLLEAIFFAATGRPSRANRDSELIRFGEAIARVEVHAKKRFGEAFLEAALERIESFSARKILKLNHQLVRKLSELLGEVKVVLFTPFDHNLASGEPSFRRKFLDLTISQISPSYLHHLQQYQMIKEQRNFLLKRPHSLEELEPWNAQLVETGSHLLLKRLEVLPRLAFLASQAHEILSKGKALSLAYSATIFLQEKPLQFPLSESFGYEDIAKHFQKALQATAKEEAQRGITLVGPHRDDFQIFLDNVEARTFASQGEQKIIAVALKMAEGGLYEELDGEPPIYLLDDCFSELDSQHQEGLTRIFLHHAQAFLTTASMPLFEIQNARHIFIPTNQIMTETLPESVF
jgi:DNA replication and repair protein RecF